MKPILNMQGLIADLAKAYEELRNKKLDLEQAREVASLSNKLIRAAGSQLQYNQFMKNGERIAFFETTTV